MKLLELFERKKERLSPEDLRLKTILGVMQRRMKQEKLPSHLSWSSLESVLNKAGIPFGLEQVKSVIEKTDSLNSLRLDDQGNLSYSEEPAMDLDMPAEPAPDFAAGLDGMGDMGQLSTADEPAPGDEEPAPEVDKNVTDQMAKRALKRRM